MVSKPFFKRKRFIIPVLILLILIVGNFLLPTIVKKYVNKTLANIPGYYGQVEDIDINLFRGAYVINGLYLNKKNANVEVPFLDFKQTDISIQWKALFNGKIVSEIVMERPKLIFTMENQNANTTDTEAEDWSKALSDLVPIDINRLKINNGMLSFLEVTAEPTIDLNIDQLSLEITNLRNVERKSKELPSTLKANGVSIGQGNLSINGKLDVIKQIPDLDLELKLENADVTSLNNFTKHYANVDFESGKYSVYGEIAIADSYMKGYVKPILTDLKFYSKEDSFLDTLWEGFVGLFKFILKNQRKGTLATKVPFEGDLSTIKTNSLGAVFNTIKNAWIQAYQNVTDDTINFESTAEEDAKEE